jgi:hypothetical protein
VYADDLNSARAYAADALSEDTRRAYEAHWRGFDDWCRVNEQGSLPAKSEVIAAYLAHLGDSDVLVRRIRRAARAIAWKHRDQGVAWRTPPIVRDVLRGIERQR